MMDYNLARGNDECCHATRPELIIPFEGNEHTSHFVTDNLNGIDPYSD